MSLKKHSRLDLLLYCLYIIKSTNQHTADNAVKCAHCASQIHPDIFFFECLCVSAGSHCKHKWLIQMWVQAARALSDAPLSGLRQNQGGVNSVWQLELNQEKKTKKLGYYGFWISFLICIFFIYLIQFKFPKKFFGWCRTSVSSSWLKTDKQK